MHTVWRCAVTGEDFLFGLTGIEEEKMVQITDSIGQRADGEIFSSEGHQVPHHPFSCETDHTCTQHDGFWVKSCTWVHQHSHQNNLCVPFLTCFVRVFCDPCNSDASNFRVTEAQEECAIWFGHQHVLSLLLVQKTQNCSADEFTTYNQMYSYD